MVTLWGSVHRMKSYNNLYYPRFNSGTQRVKGTVSRYFNPLRPNSDLSQTSHCNIKGLSVSEVMRIENKITQV